MKGWVAMLHLDIILSNEVSISTIACGVHPVRRLKITNEGYMPLEALTLTVRFSPAILGEERYPIARIGAHESVYVTPKVSGVLTPHLLRLSEEANGIVAIGIHRGDEVLAATEKAVKLLPCSRYLGETLPLSTLTHIHPEHPYVEKLVRHAGAYLHRTHQKFTLSGYHQPREGVCEQVYALYEALREEKLSVSETPITEGGLLHDFDTLQKEGAGSALDIALLFAGMLEHIGLSPILILTEHHADIGVWLTNRTFAEAVIDDPRQLSLRAAEGVEELILLDPSLALGGVRPQATAAHVLARLEGANAPFLALDVMRARESGIYPLPTLSREGEVVLTPYQDRRAHTSLHALATGSEQVLTPFDVWERQLLDLSLRNTLISQNPLRQSVPILAPSIAELIAITNKGGEFTLLSHPDEMTPDASPFDITAGVSTAILRGEGAQSRLRSYLGESELGDRLARLYRQTRIQLEESGASPLFLTLGLVKWCEDEAGERAHYAPLVLLPVSLQKKRAPKGYTLTLREDEPSINIALLSYLKANFDIAVPLGDSLPRGDAGLNLALIFNAVRRAIMDRHGWEVLESAALTTVSFGRFVLWNDIKNRKDIIGQNALVSALLQGNASGIPAVKFPQASDLDALSDPTLIPTPLPADSSQMSAIAAASCGASFVLHGPPGTGKSQTITNMIAAALANGRSVLFVAEKAAALSVVEKRLGDLGLSPFCLEIHSEKTRKSAILSKLNTTLSLKDEGDGDALSAAAEALVKERDALGNILRELHRKHPSGISLYDAIVGYLHYQGAKALPVLPPALLASLTPDGYANLLGAVRDYAAAAMSAEVSNAHPLAFYEKRTASAEDKEALSAALSNYLACASHFEGTSLALSRLLPLGNMRAYESARALRELVAYLTTLTVLPDGLLTAPTLLGMREKAERLFQIGAQRKELYERLTARFDRELLTQDAANALRDAREAELVSPILRPARRKKERVKLALFASEPNAVQVADVIPVWEAVVAYQRLGEEMVEACRSCAPLFGPLLHGVDTDTCYLSRIYEQAVAIKSLAGACILREEELGEMLSSINRLAANGGLISESGTLRTYLASFDRLVEAEEAVAKAAGASIHALRAVSEWPKSETLAFTRAKGAMHLLREYVIYLGKKDALLSLGLESLTEALEKGRIEPSEILPVFFRGSCLAIAEDALAKSPSLSHFGRGIGEERIRALGQIEANYRDLTAKSIRAGLIAHLPTPSDAKDLAGEIASLGRAIRTASRGMSIRRLFDTIPALLSRLAPCMLMSPLSAAQYLGDKHTFDLVIFDEASQLPTCEAVGTISRARSVVVVGDPKQLPPTSFFRAAREEEGMDALPESLLDDCLALGMPEQHLSWHYRSRHESLIAYSNRTYYDNALFTFPSPNAPLSRVSLRECGGIYARGGSKQNRVEAEMLVEEIVNRLKRKEQHTIGVVTFSEPQQSLIEDLLEERLSAAPELMQAADALAEPIFVKNLENVQGDERDVILFSICYGKDSTGRISLNMGPLNREGGWRRLNVAISRAREEMIVFSSLSPEEIDLSRTNADGVIGLRGFLEYAKYGKASVATKGREVAPSLAGHVAKALCARGWLAYANVGESDARVDVAVAHRDAPEMYLLGILTDAPAPGSITDRYLIRENVLRGLGWQLYYLWSVEYQDAPEAVLDRIEAILKDAHKAALLKQRESKPVVAAPAPKVEAPSIVLPKPERRSYSCPAIKDGYFVTHLAPVAEEKRNPQAFFSPENKETLLFAIREILVKEAPISHNLLTKRILEAWGIRATARTESYLHTLMSEVVCTPRVREGVRFYWALGQEAQEYNTFRIPLSPTERRESGDIPTEEVSAAVTYLTASRGSLSKDEAIREVGRVFGYTRLSAPLLEKLESGIALAIKRKEVVLRGDRLLSANIMA